MLLRPVATVCDVVRCEVCDVVRCEVCDVVRCEVSCGARCQGHGADRLANGGSGGHTRAKSRAYKRPSGLKRGVMGEGAEVVMVMVARMSAV